ncbi:CHASE2 domain-containing protein, partial [Candidatus Fermentibacterales bacterium]|nr:CHASE2 domain-containing protein [Candidatus Fermentibacterales bacterium]
MRMPGARNTRLALIALVVVLLLLPVSKLEFFETIEGKTLDLRFRLLSDTARASRDIVIVAVDGESMDRLDYLTWPWPRQIYTGCLDLIFGMGAKIVAFDILFDLPSVYGSVFDEELGAVAASGTTVFAMALHKRPGREVPGMAALDRVGGDLSGLDSAWTSTSPQPSIAEGAALLGNTYVRPDPDGVYRRMNLMTRTPVGPVPSFPLAVAILALGGPDSIRLEPDRLWLNGRWLPLDGSYELLIGYHGPTYTYEYVAIADLVDALSLRAQGL